MADAPDPISSSPSQDFQPWDAAGDAGSVSGWVKLRGGPVDINTGQLTGDDFPSSGPWMQC